VGAHTPDSSTIKRSNPEKKIRGKKKEEESSIVGVHWIIHERKEGKL